MITVSPARTPTVPRRAAALLDQAATPLLAALVALIGLQQLWIALTNAAAPTLLQDWLPAEALDGGRLVVTLAGLFLVVVAHGLARRRREAWAWACGLLALSALASLLVTHQGGTVLRALAALCLLVALRGRFAAMADPTQVRRRHLAGAGALALAAGYALGGQIILASSLAPRPGLSTALGAIIALFTSADLPYRAMTPQASWFVTSVPLVGGGALLYALVVALRPALARVRQRGERARVGQVLQRHGRTALSPFALTDDKVYCWSPDGQSVVAYAVANGVAVTCGEPVGPPAERVAALRHFRDTCRRRGLTPVLYQAGADLVPDARGLGFAALKIGEEAVLDLADFSVQGKRRANVRHSATRAERDGLAVRFFDGGVDDTVILGQLVAISSAWQRERRLKELGFSMNGFSAARARSQPVAAAVDGSGRVHAFITLLPTYADGGMALDLMRRAPEAAPGAMELLLARTAERLREGGHTYFSLGLAPLAGVGGGEHGLAGKGLDYLFRNLDGVYRYQSLHRFKDKFAPRWEDRYLLYPGPLALPSVLVALARVHVGGGRRAHPAERDGADRGADGTPSPPVAGSCPSMPGATGGCRDPVGPTPQRPPRARTGDRGTTPRVRGGAAARRLRGAGPCQHHRAGQRHARRGRRLRRGYRRRYRCGLPDHHPAGIAAHGAQPRRARPAGAGVPGHRHHLRRAPRVDGRRERQWGHGGRSTGVRPRGFWWLRA